MKVVIAHRTGQPRVVDLPESKIGRGTVMVRISHSAMQLPEELFQVEAAPRKLRRGQDGVPIGSGASGTIMEVGPGVQTLKAGLRVAVYGAPFVYHANQLVVPEAHVVELPKKVNHEEGAFAGQGALALHLVRLAGVQLGEVVLVFGADFVGQLVAQLIRAAGATPLLVDESEYRLGKARAVGIPHTHLKPDDAFVLNVTSVSNGFGADSAILTRRDDTQALSAAVQMIRVGGRIVVGVPTRESLDVASLREKEAHIISAIGGGVGAGESATTENGILPRHIARWTERENMACFCSLLAERKVQVSPLVTDRIPLERAATAYEKAARGRDSALAVVLTI